MTTGVAKQRWNKNGGRTHDAVNDIVYQHWRVTGHYSLSPTTIIILLITSTIITLWRLRLLFGRGFIIGILAITALRLDRIKKSISSKIIWCYELLYHIQCQLPLLYRLGRMNGFLQYSPILITLSFMAIITMRGAVRIRLDFLQLCNTTLNQSVQLLVPPTINFSLNLAQRKLCINHNAIKCSISTTSNMLNEREGEEQKS